MESEDRAYPVRWSSSLDLCEIDYPISVCSDWERILPSRCIHCLEKRSMLGRRGRKFYRSCRERHSLGTSRWRRSSLADWECSSRRVRTNAVDPNYCNPSEEWSERERPTLDRLCKTDSNRDRAAERHSPGIVHWSMLEEVDEERSISLRIHSEKKLSGHSLCSDSVRWTICYSLMLIAFYPHSLLLQPSSSTNFNYFSSNRLVFLMPIIGPMEECVARGRKVSQWPLNRTSLSLFHLALRNVFFSPYNLPKCPNE